MSTPNQDLVPSNIAVPAYLAQYQAALQAENDAALIGLSTPMPPSIALSGTRFVVKENGEETVLNQLELGMVVLKSKECFDKVWYATKFTPGQEPQAPDCFSRDGVVPDPSSPLPQHTACAGCPQNQFGTSTNPDGTPGKGKACGDNRILAVFANSGVYQFKIPPASLKNFASYVKQLSARGLFLSAVITKVSFDPKFTYPVLIFSCAGVLDASQFTQLQAKKEAPEVAEIIGGVKTPLLPAPATATAAVAATVPEPVAPKAPAKAQTKRAATTTPAAPVTPAVQPAPAAAAPDLGLGLTVPATPPPAAAQAAQPQTIMGVVVNPTPAQVAPAAPAQPAAAPHNQEDIAASLGIPL